MARSKPFADVQGDSGRTNYQLMRIASYMSARKHDTLSEIATRRRTHHMKTIAVIAVAALGLVALVGCPMDPGGNPGSFVPVTDDITVTTTWTSGTVYVVDTYGIYVSATLVIQPGAIVKFDGTDSGITLESGGTIVAEGTASAPIIFTSIKDDAHGGDSNGDGTATSAARRDWSMILTNGENGSSFVYCEFYYGGNSTYTATLEIDSGSAATVTNCTFAHNDWWIDNGATLTLADNVVLKFRSGSEMVLDDGASNIVNHSGTGVAFTSYKDDSLKGDTNGDASATSPAAGDWVGIYDNTAPSSPYYLTWANIFYETPE